LLNVRPSQLGAQSLAQLRPENGPATGTGPAGPHDEQTPVFRTNLFHGVGHNDGNRPRTQGVKSRIYRGSQMSGLPMSQRNIHDNGAHGGRDGGQYALDHAGNIHNSMPLGANGLPAVSVQSSVRGQHGRKAPPALSGQALGGTAKSVDFRYYAPNGSDYPTRGPGLPDASELNRDYQGSPAGDQGADLAYIAVVKVQQEKTDYEYGQ